MKSLAGLLLLCACAVHAAPYAATGALPAATSTTATTTATAALVLEDGVPAIPGEGTVTAWVDVTGNASVEYAASSPTRFQAAAADQTYALGAQSALWLRYRLTRPKGSTQEWLIEFPLPLLDSVTLYQQDAGGRWRAQQAGDTVAMASWPEPGRFPFFRLDLPPGQTRDIYARVRHATPLSVPVRFASEVAHEQTAQFSYLGLGMVFGALVLLISVCAVQSWMYRDTTYAWYSVYAGVLTLAVAAYTGVAGHALWSSSATWADTSQGCLGLLAGGTSLLFVRRLTGIVARSRRMDRAVYWIGLFGMLLAAVYAVVERSTGLMMLGPYLGLAAMLNVWMAWAIWRRGDRVGLWVLGAFVPLSVAVGLVLLRLFGWIAATWSTQYAVVVAMGLEVPLLLVALNMRSRERHAAAARELALSSQDALTGLLAHHLFMDRLRQVIARFKRDRENAAVVFIDLVNYRRIKEYYGQAVAEQSLLRAVIKLRRLLRDVDTISRVGEARFGLIMEGVTSRATVTNQGARLIAAGLMPLQGLQPEVTLQFHVGGVLLREHLADAESLCDALSDLLHGMSPRTRRPIRFLEPELTKPMPLEADSVNEDFDDSNSLPGRRQQA